MIGQMILIHIELVQKISIPDCARSRDGEACLKPCIGRLQRGSNTNFQTVHIIYIHFDRFENELENDHVYRTVIYI